MQSHIVDQWEAKRLLAAVSPANVLLVGPPGCGKTTLARAYLSQFGSILEVNGPRVKVYSRKLARHEGPVLIDEAHRIQSPESLYPLLDKGIQRGFLSRGTGPKTFAFTTTDEGKLPGPLLSRLVQVSLKPYKLGDLTKIAAQVTDELPESVLRELAKFSWGSPRRVKIFAGLLARIGITRVDQVKPALAGLGYPLGLSYRQVAMLESLSLRPLSVTTIAGMLGTGIQTIKAVESDLIQAGLIVITSKGRALTELGAMVLERVHGLSG